MPFYQKQGQLPNKRHIQFRDKNNNLYWEELVSREGFSYIYSNLYHLNPPTKVEMIGKQEPIKIEELNDNHRHRHIFTRKLNLKGDIISSRSPLFFNEDVIISKGFAQEQMDYLYRNARYDECIFIHKGKGSIISSFGEMEVKKYDYVVIPKGVIWKMVLDSDIEFLAIETKNPIETPSKYRNRLGQLLEHSPYSERDIITPNLKNKNFNGPINIKVRIDNGLQTYQYKEHPFDVVGWDGYYFPWIFNLRDFMPITGMIHQPPPVHQVFQANGVVICNFVPRLFDYHPLAVPAPYAHSNVDSDEILYYVDGNFMSRKGVETGSITFHPSGPPHGPQPGKIEQSLGAKKTDEIAVMIDTFKPLKSTKHTKHIDDKNYPYSWIEK